MTRANFFWITTAIESVRAKFPNAELRMLTQLLDPDNDAMCAPENGCSATDRTYLMPIWKDQSQSVFQTLNVDYGVRFQCKLALGFGHAMFGAAFSERPYVRTLRAGLWHRHGSGDPPSLVGKSFWGPDDTCFAAQFTNEGAFTLLFSLSKSGAWVSVFLPEGHVTHTQVLPRDELISSPLFGRLGDTFIVVMLFPAIQRCIGPLAASKYVQHRSGALVISELREIEDQRKSRAQIEAEVAKFNIPAKMEA